MIGNEFRRIALAQGLLPTMSLAEILRAADPSGTADAAPTCPRDKPAIADRHTEDA